MAILNKRVAVIGDGPAGLMLVLHLLNKVKTIHWYGENSKPGAGKLNRYNRVPANTHLKYLSAFFREQLGWHPDGGLQSISEDQSSDLVSIAEVMSRNSIEFKQDLQYLYEIAAVESSKSSTNFNTSGPNGHCDLNLLARLLAHMGGMLAELASTSASTSRSLQDELGIKSTVRYHFERVEDIIHADPSARWKILARSCKTEIVDDVVLAVGPKPRVAGSPWLRNCHAEMISLYTALDPHQLVQEVDNTDVVAVLGLSHSALLVLRNLIEEVTVRHVKCFYKKPLCYYKELSIAQLDEFSTTDDIIEYIRDYIKCNEPGLFPDGKADFLIHDNYGVKGLAAMFANTQIIQDEKRAGITCHDDKGNIFTLPHYVSTRPEQVSFHPVQHTDKPDLDLERKLDGVTKIIHAVGLERAPLPRIHYKGRRWIDKEVSYDRSSCRITYCQKNKLDTDEREERHFPGLYGAGHAFPEERVFRHVPDEIGLRWDQVIADEHVSNLLQEKETTEGVSDFALTAKHKLVPAILQIR